jgi:hypothetical protein
MGNDWDWWQWLLLFVVSLVATLCIIVFPDKGPRMGPEVRKIYKRKKINKLKARRRYGR